MKNNFYDVLVTKEYTVQVNGKPESRTAWNKVGRAWIAQNGESISFEMFHLPNQKYIIKPQGKKSAEQSTQTQPNETTPF